MEFKYVMNVKYEALKELKLTIVFTGLYHYLLSH